MLMSFYMIIAVAIGGAFGAVGRLLIHNGISHFFGHGFPLGTIVINILGSFCLGGVLQLFSYTYVVSPEIRAFFVIGILGAFTTFSTFSLDFVTLWERDEILLAWLYFLVSVSFGIVGFLAGTMITKAVSQ